MVYFTHMNDWIEQSDAIIKEFIFPTFPDAIGFINQVAAVAQELNHHPTILNVYTSVTLRLSTHDAGDIVTAKDYELASRIDAL